MGRNVPNAGDEVTVPDEPFESSGQMDIEQLLDAEMWEDNEDFKTEK